MVDKTRHPDRPGYYLIHHPCVEMSHEQRAWEMWAVHPTDLKTFGMTREEFFLAHLKAAITQCEIEKEAKE